MHSEGKKKWNGGGKAGIWNCPIEPSKGRLHPTQKPLILMQALISDFTNRGETVLDCFAGSGSTGVAALTLGRKFIGCEATDKYFKIALRRIEAAREQLSIRLEPPRRTIAKAKQLTFKPEEPNGTKRDPGCSSGAIGDEGMASGLVHNA
jgi:site-specific DNA-methyltransferase (adenine-specific)